LGCIIHSQRVLLALIDAGITREDAYKIVQENAIMVWENVRACYKADFKEMLKKDPKVKKYLTDKEIDGLFDVKYHLKYVNTIFKRAFSSK